LEVPMKILTGRFISLFAASTLLLCSTPSVFASDDRATRDVRISWVQGDVRLSRGDGKHTDLNRPWEQAQGGELLEQGFAVATGNGRAEIEFEDGSAAYWLRIRFCSSENCPLRVSASSRA